jgi:hypothetical protein
MMAAGADAKRPPHIVLLAPCFLFSATRVHQK